MKWLKNFTIILVVSVLCLKALDLAFGIIINPASDVVSPSSRYLPVREFDKNQSRILQPNAAYMLGTDSLKNTGYKIEIDENGFIRTGNKPSENPDYKVLFLGGSTTESLYVQENTRFPALIEKNLRQQLSKDVNVYNAGVSGNHTMHSNIQLIAKGIPLRPDIAVLMHNVNDLSLLIRTGSYWNAPLSRRIVANRDNDKAASIRHNILWLFHKVKNLIVPNLYAFLAPRLKAKFGPFEQDEFSDYRNTEQQIEFEAILLEYQSALKVFVSLCRAWNITPVLMTQFNRITPDNPLFTKHYEKAFKNLSTAELAERYHLFNDAIRTVALSENVILIDLAEKVPQKSEYIYDVVHLNDKGSKFVADIITPVLFEMLQSR